jgi:hypothetical protein
MLHRIRIPQAMEQETIMQPTMEVPIIPAVEVVAVQIITTTTEMQIHPLTTPMDPTRQIPQTPVLTITETTTLAPQVAQVTLAAIPMFQLRIMVLIRTVQRTVRQILTLRTPTLIILVITTIQHPMLRTTHIMGRIPQTPPQILQVTVETTTIVALEVAATLLTIPPRRM